jgi:hypothetical protein
MLKSNKVSQKISTSPDEQRVVVFDLDETLGHFHLIRLVWESIHEFINYNNIPYMMNQADFNDLFDIFPEMLRPEIISILQFLKKEKDRGACSGIMVYTNNKYPKEWVYLIIHYIEYKVGHKLFDNIVLAFKLDGRVQQMGRTSNDKKLADFVACCKLPQSVEICYFDNSEYSGMVSENVYYLKVRAYYHPFTERSIIQRTTTRPVLSRVLCAAHERHIQTFIQFFIKNLHRKGYYFAEKSFLDYEMDKVISKRIQTHLTDFFGHIVINRVHAM